MPYTSDMTDTSDILRRAELEAKGITDWSFGLKDRVRFYELDALNHVNNNAYLRWFEVLRVRYFIDYGISDYSHTDADPQLVVRHQSADFLAPMQLHQPYTAVGRMRVLKSTSFTLACAIYSEGVLTAKGETVMISLEQDGKTRRTHKPEAVSKIIELDAPEVPG